MTKRIDLEECATGRDYRQYAQENGLEVEKEGSYWKFTNLTTGEIQYWPDSNRCLPKETRKLISAALQAGLLVAALAVVMAWVF